MDDTQAMMGAIARGKRFVDAVGSDDPDHILTWGEASAAISQLIGDLEHEQRSHEATRDLVRLCERSGDVAFGALYDIANYPNRGDLWTDADVDRIRERARAAIAVRPDNTRSGEDS